MINSRFKRKLSGLLVFTMVSAFALTGCVDQHPDKHEEEISQEESSEKTENTSSDASSGTVSASEDIDVLLEISDPEEKAAVEAAKKKVAKMKEPPKIIATSPSAVDICDKLDLDLVGICHSTISDIPERYKDLPKVGTAMSPDMEIVASLQPDWILSPSSLQHDLQAKYEVLDSDWAFLNLRSVPGMYRSIQELGEIFGKEKEAQALVDEFTKFYEEYKKKNEGKERPKVLVLMGLPGSYIIATENSYVGSLVELAGGENVYAGSDREFLNVNTEDMKLKEPDVILCAAHALPDQVMQMFRDDFKTNSIWQHFEAVKQDKVYYLSYDLFGMSAKFNYPDALAELQPMLYPENEDDVKKAKENSMNAEKDADSSNATQKLDEVEQQIK